MTQDAEARGAEGAERSAEDVEAPEPTSAPQDSPTDNSAPKDSPPKSAEAQGAEPAAPPLAARVAYPLAILSGFLYFLAFPGVDLWPLAAVAWVPLIVAMEGQTPRRAMGLGWAAGFTMTMTGFYWLLEMLQTFSGFGVGLCLLFMSILCAYQGGRIALMGWLYGRARARGWLAGGAFAAAFVASELLFPLLFPWYYAATVHQLPALLQVAELGSPIGVGLTLVALNWAIASLIIARRQGRAEAWRTLALLAAVPLISAAYGAVRIHQVDAAVAAAQKAKVGVVQGNMSLMGKRSDREEGLRRHLRLSQDLVRREGPLDLVVWPETAVVGALDESTANLHYQLRVTPYIGAPAVFGGVLVRQVEDARGYVLFNSALVSGADGKVVGRYDKHYLLAFGEYLPFGETFPSLYEISRNSGRFTPGTEAKPIPFGDRHLAVFICYEDIIPSFVNSIMREGEADLLVNITNDAWFGDTTEPWIHLALSKLRAIEQRRFFVRSTNSGVSAVMDPVGRVVGHTGTFQEDTLAAEVAWLQGGTPYRVYGDAPWYLISLLSLGFAFIPRSRLLKRRQAA